MAKKVGRGSNALTAGGRASKLVGLAQKRWGVLRTAEKMFLAGAAEGDFVVIQDHNAKNFKIELARNWDARRYAIRAETIVWAITDAEARQYISHHGLCVKGARIDGALNLEFISIPFPLFFAYCFFEEPISLLHAQLSVLSLSGSHVNQIYAEGIQIKSGAYFTHGFSCQRHIRMRSARIGGGVDFTGAALHYQRADEDEQQPLSLDLALAEIGGDLRLCSQVDGSGKGKGVFCSHRTVVLRDAHVRGDLNCAGGRFQASSGEHDFIEWKSIAAKSVSQKSHYAATS